jgi:hypothetical protein
VCALKFGVAQYRVGNEKQISVHGCAHLNLALGGAELVMHKTLWCTGV